MKTNTKKGLAWLMSLSLCLCLLPVAALADDEAAIAEPESEQIEEIAAESPADVIVESEDAMDEAVVEELAEDETVAEEAAIEEIVDEETPTAELPEAQEEAAEPSAEEPAAPEEDEAPADAEESAESDEVSEEDAELPAEEAEGEADEDSEAAEDEQADAKEEPERVSAALVLAFDLDGDGVAERSVGVNSVEELAAYAVSGAWQFFYVDTTYTLADGENPVDAIMAYAGRILSRRYSGMDKIELGACWALSQTEGYTMAGAVEAVSGGRSLRDEAYRIFFEKFFPEDLEETEGGPCLTFTPVYGG